jgi:hypothetical protein
MAWIARVHIGITEMADTMYEHLNSGTAMLLVEMAYEDSRTVAGLTPGLW